MTFFLKKTKDTLPHVPALSSGNQERRSANTAKKTQGCHNSACMRIGHPGNAELSSEQTTVAACQAVYHRDSRGNRPKKQCPTWTCGVASQPTAIKTRVSFLGIGRTVAGLKLCNTWRGSTARWGNTEVHCRISVDMRRIRSPQTKQMTQVSTPQPQHSLNAEQGRRRCRLPGSLTSVGPRAV